MNICRITRPQLLVDGCQSVFRPLKIEIAIETLGSNTLVKAKSWRGAGGPMNRVPGPSGPPASAAYGSYESEVKTSFKVKRNELKVPIKVEQINDNLFSILKH
jgi:hypothetical protein